MEKIMESMTRQEAAAKLGVSDQTVTKLVKAGQLHAYHVGRRVRVVAASVAEYLARCQAEAMDKGKDKEDA